ncbi:MAG TPA: pyridoxamine 5'-phosphate oxidase family protein, partial [Chitinophagaceae bacterium]|nr:pyridoxamine 5'-phosphate oxidase family protein [Chitinophagaceae bacterium]
GYVWFLVQKPRQDLREFDSEFPVRLDYYKKGAAYFLQVSGKASMVHDPEEMNHLELLPAEARGKVLSEMVLIKVKMLKAEYHQTQTATRHSWWQNAFSALTTWFRSSNNGYGNTYYPAS